MKKSIILIVMLFVIAFIGCSKTAIEGKINDGFGNPVKDATVKVEGTQFTAQTNGSGEYSVGYVPGEVKVLVSKPGYTDESFSVNISTESTFPAEVKIIYEIPKENGIFLMQDGAYKPLSRGKLFIDRSNINDGGWFTTKEKIDYNIEWDNNNIVTTKRTNGSLTFFDNDPDNNILVEMYGDWRLANSRTALSRILNNGNLGFAMGDYKDEMRIVDVSRINFNNNCSLIKVNPSVGYYIFTQYQKRSSNPIQGNLYVFNVTD